MASPSPVEQERERQVPSHMRGSLDAALRPLDLRSHGGPRLLYLERVASTMDSGRSLADLVCPEGLVVLADLQEQGRGRLARPWLAPAGSGLTFSLVMRPRPEESQGLWAMAGVGVAWGLRDLGVEAGLKWPNDVLVGGRKLCGILVEASWSGNAPQEAVIGVGCNVNLDVERVQGIADTATSLSRELGHPLSRMEVLEALLQGLGDARRTLGRDPAELLGRYREISVVLGRRVTAAAGESTLAGTALDVDGEGRLVLRDDAGAIHRLSVGEVSLALPPA